MHVEEELEVWPEGHERKRYWVSDACSSDGRQSVIARVWPRDPWHLGLGVQASASDADLASPL